MNAIREDSIQLGIKDISKSKAVAEIEFFDNEKMLMVENTTAFSSNSYAGDEYCEVKVYPQYEEGFGFKVLDKKRFDDVISKYKHKQVAD